LAWFTVHVGLRVVLGIPFDKGVDVWIYWHKPQRKEKKRKEPLAAWADVLKSPFGM
jgi:hypothetical protein